VHDVRAWVGAYLREQDGKTGGRVGKYVQERLSDEGRAALMQVMQG